MNCGWDRSEEEEKREVIDQKMGGEDEEQKERKDRSEDCLGVWNINKYMEVPTSIE